MAQYLTKVNRLNYQYTEPDDGEILINNSSYYNNQLKQTGYNNLLSNFTDSLINSLLRTFPDESNISTEYFDITIEDRNRSENNFRLATLLEENWWNVFNSNYLRHSCNWTLSLITSYLLIFIIGVINK